MTLNESNDSHVEIPPEFLDDYEIIIESKLPGRVRKEPFKIKVCALNTEDAQEKGKIEWNRATEVRDIRVIKVEKKEDES